MLRCVVSPITAPGVQDGENVERQQIERLFVLLPLISAGFGLEEVAQCWTHGAQPRRRSFRAEAGLR